MKPENRFIAGVHKELAHRVYREKMYNPMRGGTPDCYYEGPYGDLWVEYKWLKSFPKIIVPDLSPLQRVWLERNYKNGHEPWVVVGSPTGCIVLHTPAEWDGVARDEAQVLSKQELARRIENRCGFGYLAELPLRRKTSTRRSSSPS